MKLPFLNRQRYIVLKCYSTHSGVVERAPIKAGVAESVNALPPLDYLSRRTSFTTCWSRLMTAKNSVTIPSPATFRFSCDASGVVSFAGAGNVVGADFDHNEDPTYGLNKDFVIAKIMMPWSVEEKTGTKFVFARHIHNKTMMNVLSGVHSFAATCDVNIFNAIAKVDHQYEVPFLTPMASLYAMSDLPVHVENFYDKEKHEELRQKMYDPYFRAGGIKREK